MNVQGNLSSTGCRIEQGWSLHGLRAIRIANRHLEVVVLPELGGKIWSFVDKRADRDLLWHSPRIEPHRAPLHANFDDHWSGGWDEGFPSGAPSRNEHGEELPYLGELWTKAASWTVEEAGEERVTLCLRMSTPITPAAWERRLTLARDSRTLRIDYRLRNVGTAPFTFNWGLHPALAVSSAHRLDVPAARGLVDVAGGDGLGAAGDRYDWPHLGGRDLRRVLSPTARCFAQHYLTELRAGWVACTDTGSRRGFALTFDRELFPVVWAWLVYGGWRGYHHAILEPWTGYPAALADAAAAGRALRLAEGEELRTTVCAHLYDGVASVAEVAGDGTVTGG